MTKPEWRIRVATKKDRALLEGFECADSAVDWSVEVERFIRHASLDWALAPGASDDDPRLLLMLRKASKSLLGVVAHERTTLVAPNGETFAATKVEVIALSRKWQGRKFETGERASDVLMSALMQDVKSRVPPRDARVFAVVHAENAKSIALCKRHGLVDELSPLDDGRYRRLITKHKRSRRAAAS